jgi:predicted nuclease of predicted toxin-antitoxin system
MRFLADENVPAASVRRLRAEGHDVASASEDAPGARDADVLARAAAEGRVVLTFDRDYGELLYRRAAPAPPGVVYLRFRPAHPEEPAERVLALLAAGAVAREGHRTVLAHGHVRQRALP